MAGESISAQIGYLSVLYMDMCCEHLFNIILTFIIRAQIMQYRIVLHRYYSIADVFYQSAIMRIESPLLYSPPPVH